MGLDEMFKGLQTPNANFTLGRAESGAMPTAHHLAEAAKTRAWEELQGQEAQEQHAPLAQPLRLAPPTSF